MKKIYLSLLALVLICSCTSDSENPVEEQIDTTPPQVEFTITGFPNASNTTPIVVSNQLEISIATQDAGGIEKVEAFIGNQKVAEDNTSPYNLVIDLSGFESKSSNGNFKDYVLRIDVSDLAGNVTSKEQLLNIDNELPVISEVSIEAGAIINGQENVVNFMVNDNEGLKNVKAYINNDLLQEFTDAAFEFNIDTTILNDGSNSIRIEAQDLADNTTTFEVEFIVDNTGPEITISNLVEDQLLDAPFQFAPQVEDTYSPIALFTAKLNETIILESTSNEIGSIQLDPEEFSAGDVVFELFAADDLGNETTVSINGQILRRLFNIQLESGFFESTWFGFHVVISEMDGSFITLKTIDINENEAIVYAPGEFSLDKEYMVSFIADENQGGRIKTHMTIVQHLTRTNFDQINFTAPFGESINQQSIPMAGFDGIENVLGRGHGYMSNHNSDLSELTLEQNEGNGYATYPSFYLTGYELGDDPSYGYLKIDNPWETNFTVNKSDFVFDNVLMGTASFAGNTLPINDRNLYIWGFENETDFNNNVSHLIHDSNFTFGPVGSETYYYPTVFERYKHHLRLDNYNIYQNGLPESDYLIPNWNIDHVQNGNQVNLEKSGSGHIVGRLIVEIGSENDSQLMAVLFDSSKGNTVHLPVLPAVLESLNIYQIFQNQTYSVDYSELISFGTITTYGQYIKEAIEPYKEHTEVSPRMESLTNRNAFIFNNWSFKYQ